MSSKDEKDIISRVLNGVQKKLEEGTEKPHRVQMLETIGLLRKRLVGEDHEIRKASKNRALLDAEGRVAVQRALLGSMFTDAHENRRNPPTDEGWDHLKRGGYAP